MLLSHAWLQACHMEQDSAAVQHHAAALLALHVKLHAYTTQHDLFSLLMPLVAVRIMLLAYTPEHIFLLLPILALCIGLPAYTIKHNTFLAY